MSRPTGRSLPCLALVGLAACGVSAGRPPDGAPMTDAKICGTHANPGILSLDAFGPSAGSIVVNQTIIHGFIVLNAPAEFNNF
jgi:hypothetical protein